MGGRRVVIVTGGASGIGLGISRRFAAIGDAVAMLDVDEALLAREAEALARDGAAVLPMTVDVADRAQIDTAYAAVRERFGPIGIVVANAGISGTQKVLTMPATTWQRMIDVNLTGVFHSIQAGLGDMVAQSWGRIVAISSQAAQSGAADRAHYAAAKGGVIALTKSLAQELARYGITVNTIPPSLVDTPLMHREAAAGSFRGVEAAARGIPLARAGTPDDIADACEFLCSDKAGYITGQQINVNGGTYM